jgi:hypothetical protein
VVSLFSFSMFSLHGELKLEFVPQLKALKQKRMRLKEHMGRPGGTRRRKMLVIIIATKWEAEEERKP